MHYEIESGIPYPSPMDKHRQGLPFDKLEVGQSFFVPMYEKRVGTVHVATVRANMNKLGRVYRTSKQTKTFTVEGQEPTTVAGTRVWRIE
jgi:hypothetical protein